MRVDGMMAIGRKIEVDEKFYCHILFDGPNERHEGIAKEAKERCRRAVA
jgi:hypothetical protein